MSTGDAESKSQGSGENTPPVAAGTTTTTIENLGDILSNVTIGGFVDDDGLCSNSNCILVCDAGYGFPREKVPRKEKINAIASQLSNFIQWQQKIFDEKNSSTTNLATVQIVGCPDETILSTLETRLLDHLSLSGLPDHVKISCDALETFLSSLNVDGKPPPVYLSPDAEEYLDPSAVPPKVVIVGLLIDRRVQPNRSMNRASKLNIVAKRWPLEGCFIDVSSKEPLNVDCVLEGMQQWWWNCDDVKSVPNKERFIQAASQAIEHHAKRHPSRPLHLSGS
jgi:hypothetical protein